MDGVRSFCHPFPMAWYRNGYRNPSFLETLFFLFPEFAVLIWVRLTQSLDFVRLCFWCDVLCNEGFYFRSNRLKEQ